MRFGTKKENREPTCEELIQLDNEEEETGRPEREGTEPLGEERNILREVLSFLCYAAVIFGCTFLIIMFVAQRTSVSGHSMNDTLQD